jgi:hypothetical protein
MMADRKRIDSRFFTIENMLAKILENKVDSITLTGGEPTLRKDFFELLHKVADTHLVLTVQTNGRRLSRPEAVRELAFLSRRDIVFVVALHGASASIHDRITRIPGSFGETERAIQNLLELGFPVCGKVVFSNYNLSTAPEIFSHMHQIGVREAVVAFPHAEDFSPAILQEILPKYSAVRDMLKTLSDPQAHMDRLVWETIPFCIYPSPDFFPFSLDVSLLREKLHDEATFIEMTMTGETISWSESRQAIKNKPPQCQGCVLDRICEGAWAEYFSVHGADDFVPIHDMGVVEAFIDKLA